MNFTKGLQTSWDKITHDVKSQIARSNPLQHPDTKTLSMWIYEERDTLASIKATAYHHAEANKGLAEWLKSEQEKYPREDVRDLEDLGSKLVILLEKQTEVEEYYATKYQQYRQVIKSIRKREEQLTELHEKKLSLESRMNQIAKTNPGSPKVTEMQTELGNLEKEYELSKVGLQDFKRFGLREAFYLRFNAMNEYAEKTAMLAGYGKYLVDLLDVEPTPVGQEHRREYVCQDQAGTILSDALRTLDKWNPPKGDERFTLANEGLESTFRFGFEEDASMLTDEDIERHQDVVVPSLLVNGTNSSTATTISGNNDSNKNTTGVDLASIKKHTQDDQFMGTWALDEKSGQTKPLDTTPAAAAAAAAATTVSGASGGVINQMNETAGRPIVFEDDYHTARYDQLYEKMVQHENNSSVPRPYSEFKDQFGCFQGSANPFSLPSIKSDSVAKIVCPPGLEENEQYKLYYGAPPVEKFQHSYGEQNVWASEDK
ncbi:Eisosome component PIL1-domain-containing protein [Phycomyces blakesleeanus]|uniref:Eisosome component PIL1-domain-containing protein n=1 Tax=Phycomyces blakesleeanus TaxID=4837 RepID=A0ABR3BGE4_PHYBL